MIECSVFYSDRGFSGILSNGKAYYFDNKGKYNEKPIQICFDEITSGTHKFVKCVVDSIAYLKSYSNMNITNFFFIERVTNKTFTELFGG